MLKLFIAIFSIILLYWLWSKKKQIFNNQSKKVDPFITTIEAIELQTFLAWDTPRPCLESDGIRYGKQFKQKTPPELPHVPGCKCEAIKLFYTSDDVFQGTSPVLKHKSELGDLCTKDALLLKRILLRIICDSKIESFSDLISDLETNNFSEDIRSQAISLLKRAFEASKS